MLNLLAIFCAKYLFLLSLIIGGVCTLKLPKKAQRSILLFGILTLALTYLTGVIVGHFYYNPRPFVVGHFIPLIPHDPDNGFPSDHTLLVSAIAAVWSYYDRRIAAMLWAIALLVAAGRVAVGVHHAIDVFASMIIAAAVSWLVYKGIASSKLVDHFDR